MLDTFEHLDDEVGHGHLVIDVGGMGHTIGDNMANGDGLVTKHACKACKGSRLHLIVSDAIALVIEFPDALVDERRGNGKAQYASLWAIESDCRNGDTCYHIIAGNAGCEILVGMYHVGIGSFLRITDKRGKLALQGR